MPLVLTDSEGLFTLQELLEVSLVEFCFPERCAVIRGQDVPSVHNLHQVHFTLNVECCCEQGWQLEIDWLADPHNKRPQAFLEQ